MADDKKGTTYPVDIDFYSSEQPTAVKLTYLSSQAKAAVTILEKVIGDVWGEYYGTTGQDNPAVINIARTIGMLKHLTPRSYPASDVEVAITLGAGTVHVLPFCPHDDLSTTVSGISFDSAPLQGGTCHYDGNGTPPNDGKFGVNGTGDYYVSSAGVLYCYDDLTAGIEATYSADIPSDIGMYYAGGGAWRPNSYLTMYPAPFDIATLDPVKRLTINTGSGGHDYLITLPASIGAVGSSGTRSTLDASGKTSDQVPSGSESAAYWAQSMSLPPNIVALGTGAAVPQGLMMIYKVSTQSIIQGVTFTTKSFVAGSTEIYADDSAAGLLTTSATPSSDYILIVMNSTGGADLTSQLDYNRYLLLNHKHKRDYNDDGANTPTGDPTYRIDHADLEGLIPTSADTGLPATQTRITIPPSRWQQDDHVQYLHRWGWDGRPLGSTDPTTSEYQRDPYGNAMLGDLLLASKNSGTRYNNITDDSRRIVFGSLSVAGAYTGPSIYYDQGNTALTFTTVTGGAYDFIGGSGDVRLTGTSGGTAGLSTGGAGSLHIGGYDTTIGGRIYMYGGTLHTDQKWLLKSTTDHFEIYQSGLISEGAVAGILYLGNISGYNGSAATTIDCRNNLTVSVGNLGVTSGNITATAGNIIASAGCIYAAGVSVGDPYNSRSMRAVYGLWIDGGYGTAGNTRTALYVNGNGVGGAGGAQINGKISGGSGISSGEALQDYSLWTQYGIRVGSSTGSGYGLLIGGGGAYIDGRATIAGGGDLYVITTGSSSSGYGVYVDGTSGVGGIYSNAAIVVNSGGLTINAGGADITGNLVMTSGGYIRSSVGNLLLSDNVEVVNHLYVDDGFTVSNGSNSHFTGNVFLEQDPGVGGDYYLKYDDSGDKMVFRSASSKKYKEDIKDMLLDTSKVYDLRPVSFIWKKNKKTSIGLIAEEVAMVMPQLAVFDKNKEPDAVDYPLLAVLMLPEMKKLRDKNIELEERLAKLEAKLG